MFDTTASVQATVFVVLLFEFKRVADKVHCFTRVRWSEIQINVFQREGPSSLFIYVFNMIYGIVRLFLDLVHSSC